ncbi:MAG TPA: hypothetical protein VI790_02235, partial [Candidatus Nanoarchaeia archaeon]|nr:hypothetical protein [Candidatus Nanoarchaeia archaeon]
RWFDLINRFSFGQLVEPKATYLSKILTDDSIATVNNGVPDVRDLNDAIDFAIGNGSDYFFTGDAFGGSSGAIKPKMWALKNRELVETSILAPYTIPAIEVAKKSKSRTPFEIPDSVFNYIEQFKLRR